MPARSHSPKRAEPPWLAYRDAHRSLNQRSDLFGDISATLPDHKGGFFLWSWGHCRTRVARPINPNTGLANGWHRVWTSKRAKTGLCIVCFALAGGAWILCRVAFRSFALPKRARAAHQGCAFSRAAQRWWQRRYARARRSSQARPDVVVTNCIPARRHRLCRRFQCFVRQ